jgi:uncharacterized 2Fe-2S/4Fe-4S cluster protein (DUF4445 family)
MVDKLPLQNELTVEWSGPGRCTLLELLRAAGLAPESSCGSRGKCGKCRVRVISGDCTVPGEDELAILSAEELDSGIRLACCCRAKGKIILLSGSDEHRTRILENGLRASFQLEPSIIKQEVTISRDCGQGSLLEHLNGQTGAVISENSLLPALTLLGECGQDSLTAIIKDGAILGFEAAGVTKDCYGLAVDIGTTTVVAGLLALNDGCELAVASALNPQKEYGLDVLSRIQHVQNDPSGLKTLNTLIMSCLNDLIEDLCNKSGINHLQIYEITVAANAVMLHLFLGVNPRRLGRFPYHTVFREGITVGAKELGLDVSPFARVYCMPSVSSFVGADIVAGIIATGLDRSENTELFLDIGTNGEIVLNKGGRLLACSAAAGPALEGMNISCGMRAAEGAVEEVSLWNGAVGFRTIGNLPPQGLCGSGLLDLAAELLDAGVILPSGKMAAKEEYQAAHPGSPLVGSVDNSKKRFWLEQPVTQGKRGVYLSQADVRQLQLAKGAIVAGIKTLLSRSELGEGDIGRVYLAGAFGTYVRPRNLIRLGFFPAAWQDRICFAGNSSKAGAVMALLSGAMRARAEEISRRVDYFELSKCSDFEKLFVDNMTFAYKIKSRHAKN